MYSIATFLSDLKGDFEGGNSLTIDWYALIRRAAQTTLNNIHPGTQKRTVPIYGGLTRGLQVYYCPSDLDVPARLWSCDRTAHFDYVPPADYYRHGWNQDRYTIESINGVRFIVVRHPLSLGSIILDAMDGTTSHTGTVSLTQNTFNFLPGSAASMQGTFTSSAYEVDYTLPSTVDISAYLYGVALMPLYIPSAFNLDHVELDLIDSNGNQYAISSTQDSVGDYIRDGQNFVRFQVQSAVKTGTPDPSKIASYKLKVVMKNGTSQTVIIGKLSIQKSQLFFLSYQSNQTFVNPTTGAWSDTPAAGYNINLSSHAKDILFYETERLVIQAAAIEKVNAPEETRITQSLARAYDNYYHEHPSEAQPLSYNIRPDISHVMSPYYDGAFGEFGDEVGSNTDAELFDLPIVYFADAETPQGIFNGINTTFTLLHFPAPALSLRLILNGNELTQGIDYTLAGNTITFISPPSAIFAVDPFIAYYRYLV